MRGTVHYMLGMLFQGVSAMFGGFKDPEIRSKS